MRSASENTIGLLQRPDIADGLFNSSVGDVLNRRHIAEFPVMRASAVACGEPEGLVAMMARVINAR